MRQPRTRLEMTRDCLVSLWYFISWLPLFWIFKEVLSRCRNLWRLSGHQHNSLENEHMLPKDIKEIIQELVEAAVSRFLSQMHEKQLEFETELVKVANSLNHQHARDKYILSKLDLCLAESYSAVPSFENKLSDNKDVSDKVFRMDGNVEGGMVQDASHEELKMTSEDDLKRNKDSDCLDEWSDKTASTPMKTICGDVNSKDAVDLTLEEVEMFDEEDKSWDVPKDKSWDVPKDKSWDVLKDKSWDVPKDKSWDVPKDKSWDVPRDTAWAVPRDKAWNVPIGQSGVTTKIITHKFEDEIKSELRVQVSNAFAKFETCFAGHMKNLLKNMVEEFLDKNEIVNEFTEKAVRNVQSCERELVKGNIVQCEEEYESRDRKYCRLCETTKSNSTMIARLDNKLAANVAELLRKIAELNNKFETVTEEVATFENLSVINDGKTAQFMQETDQMIRKIGQFIENTKSTDGELVSLKQTFHVTMTRLSKMITALNENNAQLRREFIEKVQAITGELNEKNEEISQLRCNQERIDQTLLTVERMAQDSQRRLTGLVENSVTNVSVMLRLVQHAMALSRQEQALTERVRQSRFHAFLRADGTGRARRRLNICLQETLRCRHFDRGRADYTPICDGNFHLSVTFCQEGRGEVEAYVVGSDGSRYFMGATNAPRVPGGRAQIVTLQRDCQYWIEARQTEAGGGGDAGVECCQFFGYLLR